MILAIHFSLTFSHLFSLFLGSQAGNGLFEEEKASMISHR